MAWWVARPVASAATACLYAHGDGEPARALTCVSILPPAAAAVAGSGGEGRTPVARCSRRWLLSRACRGGHRPSGRSGGAGRRAAGRRHPGAPAGGDVRRRARGLPARPRRAPRTNTSAAGTAHACARRCAAALACRAWSWLAATGACSLLGANASTVVEATLRRDCASGVVDGPAFEVRTRSCPATARACAPAGGLRVLPGHLRRPDGAPPDAAALAALCAGTPSTAVAVVVAQVYGAAYAHFLLDNLSRWARPGLPRRPPRSSASRRPATARGAARRRRRGTASCTRPWSPRAPPRGTTRSTRGRRWSRCSATSARRGSRVTTAPGPFAVGARAGARRVQPPHRRRRAPRKYEREVARSRKLALRHALGADALRAAASPVDVLVLRRTGTRAIANHDELVAALRRAGLATRAASSTRRGSRRRGASWRSSRGRHPSSSARTAPA